jgi:hypothetical protein
MLKQLSQARGWPVCSSGVGGALTSEAAVAGNATWQSLLSGTAHPVSPTWWMAAMRRYR